MRANGDEVSAVDRDVARLAETLAADRFGVIRDEKVAGESVLVARRSEFQWTGRLHFFVVVFVDSDLDPGRAEELSASAQGYAIRHKGGLPRGLQTGTVTFPTFLSREPSAALTGWFETEPHQRFAAMQMPVLADLAARRLVWYGGRLSRGFLFQQRFDEIIRGLLAPALNCAASV